MEKKRTFGSAVETLFRLALLLCCICFFTGQTDVVWAEDGGSDTAASDNPAACPATTDFTGTVLETFDSGGYTYVHVDTGTDKIWAATKPFTVKKGDQVRIHAGMPMRNFHSNTLNRTFELIYFSPSITTGRGAESQPGDSVNPHTMIPRDAISGMDFSDIRPLKDGYSIADIYKNKEKLKGKTVRVRGKVVKFTPEVMGKNWMHIQDGTGEGPTADLTVTTEAKAQTGDTVIIEGHLLLDQDFSFGYRYDVLVENAKVTIEKNAPKK